jgi:hypothetical protein
MFLKYWPSAPNLPPGSFLPESEQAESARRRSPTPVSLLAWDHEMDLPDPSEMQRCTARVELNHGCATELRAERRRSGCRSRRRERNSGGEEWRGGVVVGVGASGERATESVILNLKGLNCMYGRDKNCMFGLNRYNGEVPSWQVKKELVKE